MVVGIDEPAHAVRQPRGQAGIALAGHGRVGAPAEPAPLQEEGAERQRQQHDRKRGGAAGIVLAADDREEDVGRKHVEIAAEHQRVAEIGEALDEADEEGVGEAGAHQRPGHGAERAPAVGAQASAPPPPSRG